MSDLQKEEKTILKKILNTHRSEIKRAINKKRRPNTKPTGFATEKQIGGEFADWLHVERGTTLTGPAISKKFWERMREEGLLYENDERIFRTNNEVSRIFNVKPSVNKSKDSHDDDGFNMRNYQCHIKYALKNNNS